MLLHPIGAFFLITIFGFLPAFVSLILASDSYTTINFEILGHLTPYIFKIVWPLFAIIGLIAAISLLLLKKIHPFALCLGILIVYLVVITFIKVGPADLVSDRIIVLGLMMVIYCTIVMGWLAKQLFDKAGVNDGLSLDLKQTPWKTVLFLCVAIVVAACLLNVAETSFLNWMLYQAHIGSNIFFSFNLQPFIPMVIASALGSIFLVLQLTRHSYITYRKFTRAMMFFPLSRLPVSHGPICFLGVPLFPD